MRYNKLGRSGLKVSPLCLGTMMFGAQTSEADAVAMVARARAWGVNFIDTADAYNEGMSEQVVGNAIHADRDWWIVATKLANPTGPGPNDRGTNRRHVIAAAEASLKRLRTGWIDVLYLHKEDHTTPLAETVRAIADLMRAGKIRHFGVSNYRAWRIGEICSLCDSEGIDRPVVSQPLYNILNRMVEVEHLPACGAFGLGVFPYSPLARGILTAKYRPDVPPPQGTRAGRQDKRMMETEWRPESLHLAQTIAERAAAKGVTPVQFAIAWLLANPLVTGAVAGPRTMEQWLDYEGALDCKITAEDEALIDRLVPPGHPSTPGYNDPAYPLEGRPVR